MKVKILLVEDHHVIRASLKALLESQPDLEVAGETDSGCAGGGPPEVNSCAPTAAATRTRSSRIFAAPPPLGWTRLVSTTR